MKQKWVKRIARAMLPCFVFFVFSFSFAPKAHAVSWEGTMSYGIYTAYISAYSSPVFNAGNGSLPVINGSVSTAGGTSIGNTIGRSDARFSFGQTTNFTGPVKLYASYYFVDSITNSSALTTASYSDRFFDKDAWDVTYTNSYGQIAEVNGGVDVFEATTSQSASAINGKTFILEASWQGSEGLPITSLNVVRYIGSPAGTSGGQQNAYPDAQGLYVTRWWNPIINFPSVRVITTTTSEEMESLDNIASEIAAQSDILLAMKGDLVAILQDIYQMTGDIHIAQNLLNTYVQQMLPLLENIDRTTTNIYSLLSTQLQALETAINNAATSIEAAISAQTAAMIAYLESVLNTGNEVPDDTYQQQQDAANILDQMESLQKPNVDTVVPEIGDYSDSGVSGVFSAIFSSNLIVTMMTLSASFAFGAYVLFGKRD